MPAVSKARKALPSTRRGIQKKLNGPKMTWKTKVDQTFKRLTDLPFDSCCEFSSETRNLMDDLLVAGHRLFPDMLRRHSTIKDLDNKLRTLEAKRRKQVLKSKQGSGDDDLGCVVCHDTIDEIFDKGRRLDAAQCGHLFCSGCLQTVQKRKQCPRCKVAVTAVRRLYVV